MILLLFTKSRKILPTSFYFLSFLGVCSESVTLLKNIDRISVVRQMSFHMVSNNSESEHLIYSVSSFKQVKEHCLSSLSTT